MKLEKALAKRKWPAVLRLLQQGLSDSQRAWAVEEAIQHAKDHHLELIISYCTDDQLDAALKIAVVKRFWSSVVGLLKREVGDAKRAWAVEEALRHAVEEHTDAILPLCADGQLEATLEIAVERRLWSPVSKLLERNLSLAKRDWVIKAAIERAEGEHLTRILPQCSDDQLGVALAEAVKRGLWGCVTELLCRVPRLEQLRPAVKEALNRADDDELKPLVSRCHTLFDANLINEILTLAVARRLWGCVAVLVQETKLTQQQKCLVASEACKGDRELFPLNLLQIMALDSDFVELVLPDLIRCNQWPAIRELMVNGVKLTKNPEIFVEASKTASEKDLSVMIVQCPDVLLDSIARELVKRGLWNAVGGLISKKVGIISRSVCRLVVEEAAKHAGEYDLLMIIVHCPDSMLSFVLTEAVNRGFWSIVSTVLNKNMYFVSPDVRIRAVEELAKHTDNVDLELIFRYAVSIDVLVILDAKFGRWSRILKILSANPNCNFKTDTLRFTLEEASKHVNEQLLLDLLGEVFCLCFTWDAILRNAAQRGMWRAAAEILGRRVSEAMQKFAVDRALRYSAGLVETSNLETIFLSCIDDQLDSVVTEGVRKKMWTLIRILLTREVSYSLRRWALDEASKYASEHELFSMLLYHSSEVSDQLSFLLTTIVRRELWKSVGLVLDCGQDITARQKKQVLRKASERGTDDELRNILHHCGDDQWESMLDRTVQRQMWISTRYILSFGGIPTKRMIWVLEEASEKTTDTDMCLILRACPKPGLDYTRVFKTLLERKMWNSVSCLLELGRDSVRQRRRARSQVLVQGSWRQRLAPLHQDGSDDQLETMVRTMHSRVILKRLQCGDFASCVRNSISYVGLAEMSGSNCIVLVALFAAAYAVFMFFVLDG